MAGLLGFLGNIIGGVPQQQKDPLEEMKRQQTIDQIRSALENVQSGIYKGGDTGPAQATVTQARQPNIWSNLAGGLRTIQSGINTGMGKQEDLKTQPAASPQENLQTALRNIQAGTTGGQIQSQQPQQQNWASRLQSALQDVAGGASDPANYFINKQNAETNKGRLQLEQQQQEYMKPYYEALAAKYAQQPQIDEKTQAALDAIDNIAKSNPGVYNDPVVKQIYANLGLELPMIDTSGVMSLEDATKMAEEMRGRGLDVDIKKVAGGYEVANLGVFAEGNKEDADKKRLDAILSASAKDSRVLQEPENKKFLESQGVYIPAPKEGGMTWDEAIKVSGDLKEKGFDSLMKPREDGGWDIENVSPFGPTPTTNINLPEDQGEIYKRTTDLRKEFQSQKEYEYYIISTDAERTLNAALNMDSASRVASDQVIGVKFQKLIDQGSVVRESEYARTAAGIALLNKATSIFDQMARGGMRMTDSDRVAIYEMAQKILEVNKEQLAKKVKEYKGISEYAGVDPKYVLGPTLELLGMQENTERPKNAFEELGTKNTSEKMADTDYLKAPKSEKKGMSWHEGILTLDEAPNNMTAKTIDPRIEERKKKAVSKLDSLKASKEINESEYRKMLQAIEDDPSVLDELLSGWGIQ